VAGGAQKGAEEGEVTDPFRIEGPAVVNVSGGRTSAHMLRLILAACGGRLPRDVFAVFCNTGDERAVDEVVRAIKSLPSRGSA
jgi:NH3-dependent NAD+ synthetase